MRPKDPLRQPLAITPVDGEIVFLGEGAVNFSMTPWASLLTLRQLAQAIQQMIIDGSLVLAEIHVRRVVLLVEDEPLIRELGATVLQTAGYVVIEVPGAREALAVLEGGAEVHLLFTDVNMPGELDGLQLAHHVNDRWPAIPVLVSSGRMSPDDLPANGHFLPKPYRASQLLKQVDELVEA